MNQKLMKQPLVSIVIPIFNVEKYIYDCLESVVNQSYQLLEIICVIDGSVDNSEEIVLEFARKDQRIVVVRQENLGLSVARNTGMNAVHGDFIYFLDADDWLNLDAIELLVDAQRSSKASIVSGAIEIFYEDTQGTRPYKRRRTTGEIKLCGNNFYKLEVVVWNKLYKVDAVSGIRFKPGLIHQDEDYYWSVFSKNRRVFAIEQTVCHYRRRSDSITTNSYVDDNEQHHYVRIMEQAHECIKHNPDLKVPFLKCALKYWKRLDSRKLPQNVYLRTLSDSYGINNYFFAYLRLKLSVAIEYAKTRFRRCITH